MGQSLEVDWEEFGLIYPTLANMETGVSLCEKWSGYDFKCVFFFTLTKASKTK